MSTLELPRTYIRVPPRTQFSQARLAAHGVLGAIATPLYLVLAGWGEALGLSFRRRCSRLGLSLLSARNRDMSMIALRLLLMPMDSTRYFEFGFADHALSRVQPRRYLDVSSPRLVPVMYALSRSELHTDLINPDESDLAETRKLVDATGLSRRCNLHPVLIADAPFQPHSFDLITCISVLEHIPEDSAAVRRMWELLAPGGTLVITVPAMARACEQYIDHDEYGLLPSDSNGFVFWQRFYDLALLQERVFSVTGPPANFVVYGEKQSGSFARNAAAKRRLGMGYPFWKEPYMMAREYGYFEAVDSLPGDGVVGMAFRKP